MNSFHLGLFECPDVSVKCQNFLYSEYDWVLFYCTEGVVDCVLACLTILHNKCISSDRIDENFSALYDPKHIMDDINEA